MTMSTVIKSSLPSVEQIWAWLQEVPDPEIPVISVVDLGVVREVAWQDGDECVVTVTPTYSGCPATEVINQQIREHLCSHGLQRVHLQTRLAPAWTTDWLTPQGRARLHSYGIAPPVGLVADGWVDTGLRTCKAGERDPHTTITCPRCGSTDTELVSAFGSTPCKSLHRCGVCREPFDYFKCH
jgi:ring-1,2-phenylacetyl-CoA epoxidase subunit PaaD